MLPNFPRPQRSMLLGVFLFLFSLTCFLLVSFQLTRTLTKTTAISISARQEATFATSNTFLGLSCFCGALSGILFFIIYKRTKPTIVLHPLNDVWDPIKRLRRKSPYQYVYRSLDQLINKKPMVPQVLIPISDAFAVYLSENSRQIRDNNYLFMSCRTGCNG